MTKKFDLRSILKAAHADAKIGSYKTYAFRFARALKQAWASAKQTAVSSTKELVAKLAAGIMKFNGKVYGGFIYVGGEKMAVEADFATLWNRAYETSMTDEAFDAQMESVSAYYSFIIANI